MPVETDEDRAIFLDLDAFGVGAKYSARDNAAPPRDIIGIFDMPAREFDPNSWPGHPYRSQEGAHIVVSGPTFLCRRRDLVNGGKRRDRLVIDGAAFTVTQSMPDGTGFTLLSLEEEKEP